MSFASIIPARFLLTASHFMVSVMAYVTKDGNIAAALPLSSSSLYSNYNQSFLCEYIRCEYPDFFDNPASIISMIAAFALTWICFGAEFFGLFSGKTMFSNGSNSIHIIAHTVGTITISLFIAEAWHYVSYWYIFGFCSLFPALVELIAIASAD